MSERIDGRPSGDTLLGASEIRALAAELDLTPTKRWGQNFVVDANTVRRIVRTADVSGMDVLEVGPGRVLTGLLRSIDRALEGSAVGDLAGLEKLSQ